MIFNHHWELLNTTADMIKFRSFKWLKAEFNFPEEIFNLWQVNPAGAIMLNSKQGLYQDLVWWNAEFQAYTDGSWKIINSTTVAGIGGFITDKDREAEREAILFVYKAFTSQRTIQGRLQIRTDCLTLFNDVQKLRAGNGSPSKLSDWAGLISNPNIKVCYSPRENLSAAHDLAVQGTNRRGLQHAWC